MSVPVICPNCYRNVPVSAQSGGRVVCDSCGHSFPAPAASASPSGYVPAAPSGAPQPGTTFNFPQSTVLQPVTTPAYPPASGPQNPSKPGCLACGVVAGLGVMMLVCCGGTFALLHLADANNAGPNLPNAIVPPAMPDLRVNPPELNPRNNMGEFGFPQIPVVPPNVPDIAPVPGFPTPPTVAPPAPARSLDTVLTELNEANGQERRSDELLHELATHPADAEKHQAVVDAIFGYLDKALTRTGSAHSAVRNAAEALNVWATKDDATRIVKLVAAQSDAFFARDMLQVVVKTGGDETTAKEAAPLLQRPAAGHHVKDVLVAIGPPAEEAVLDQLETNDARVLLIAYDVLGQIGGQKSKERLAKVADKPGIHSVFGKQALNRIEAREKAGGDTKVPF